MIRFFIEEANGHNGHPYVDRTDEPMPAIMASRPINIQTIDDDKPPPIAQHE